MKSRILKGWDFVRRVWFLIGIAIAVGSVISDKLLLLIPALYFMVGAVLNIGCFAGQCTTDFDASKEVPTREIESKDTHVQ